MTSRIDLSRYDSHDSSRAESVSAPSVTGSAPLGKEPAKQPVVRPVVTREMIDQAVEKVLGSLSMSEESKDAYRKLLASDTESGFAASYYMGKADVKVFGHRPLERRVVNITPVLTTEETADLVAYAPDYELNFHDTTNHDHGMAMAMRVIDSKVMSDTIPRNVPFKDIGGDPMLYILEGVENAHVCGTLIDPKDPSRATVRLMRARRIRDEDKKYSHAQRNMASRFVAGDKTFCCGKRGEDCHYKAPITRSIHVYDVALDVWPRIMENAGASLHQGCVLFPMSAYSERVGVLKTARARYEVDVSKNKYYMGFVDSPSWLYEHNWLNFMRYAVDQIVPTATGRYSYKVAQRRGDTVFFDYVKLAGKPVNAKPVYKVPGVPMVHVNGFELTPDAGPRDLATQSRQVMRRRDYWFPAPLWQDVKRQAELDFERGVMDFKKLFNYYRTVSPRNTINGVLISGGFKVGANMMTPLVVHVGMAAAMSVILGQHTTKGLITSVMLDRLRRDSGFLRKALQAMISSIGALGSLLTWPLRKLYNLLKGMTDEALMATLIQWDLRPVVQEVPFSTLVSGGWFGGKVDWEVDGMETERALLPYVQSAETEMHGRALDKAGYLRKLVGHLYMGEPLDVEVDAGVAKSGITGDTTVVESSRADVEKTVTRKAAILECLEESVLEERKLAETCEEVYRMCTDGNGEPILTALNSRAEEYGEPDLWYINRGVLVKSALGFEGSDCKHSAVFTLEEDPATGSRFRSLREVERKSGEDSRVITDTSYTGWSVVIDRLVIFNGPEIRETLRKGLDLQHLYEVVQMQGPPGCGKTYSIIQRALEADVIQCPVRESSLDTRGKLLKKFPSFPQPKVRVSTVDSYLVNYGWDGRRQKLRTDTLLADECFMTHSGNWYAVAALLGVRTIYAYGDSEQIPHIPRVDAPDIYPKIIPDRVEYTWVSYRCPWDSVAAWGHLFDHKVRSVSTVQRSMTTSTSWRDLPVPKNLVILYMYHDTMRVLAKEMGDAFLERNGVRWMSVHQAEGKTFENVWLFRLDARPRNDTISLYDKSAYALVAMSRHTASFVYIRPRDLGDCVDTWLKNADNPRALAAAGDVESAGVSVQYK